MVTEHKRYKMQERARDDKQQLTFGSSGKVEQRKRMVTVTDSTLPVNMLVMCPFCLYQARLQRFLVSTSKGISHLKAQCPDCGNGMMMKSLTSEWTPEQYAEFVYPYAGSGFWQKCKFETWKKRLAQIGWSKRFWDRYKALKGDDETESYGEYMERKAQEDAQQWQENTNMNTQE
jgi:ribosomal protein S27AE